MPLPSYHRRGSAATSFLLLVFVVAMGFGAFLMWQRNERLRVEAEAADKLAAEQAAEEAATPGEVIEVPDIMVVAAETIPRPPILLVEPGIGDPGNEELPPVGPTWKTVGFTGVPEGAELLGVLKAQGYKFNSTVLQSYLKYAKARARADLKASKRELPEEFLRWVESDAERMLAVYCCRAEAARVLVMLRSLELDLGREDARHPKFNQLVLATAIACANQAESAEIHDRNPRPLVIPRDPRVRVNTKDPNRTLDKYDHIINFLEDHTPVSGNLAGGLTWALPEIALSRLDDGPADPTKKPVFSLAHNIPPAAKRTLIAADVFASLTYQVEFNAYMKRKGFPEVSIDCGNRVIHAGLVEGVKGPHASGILDAYRLFKTAYELKGRLAVREKPATPYERCAYIIRNEKNHISRFTAPGQARLPSFPLDAPWPMLMMLAQDGQPLREREEILERFKKTGRMIRYGEYTGGIAQQNDFQAARRLCPFPYGDNSYQQIMKDGGVCGRMANMEMRSDITIGIPSSTAGQPGHCAGVHAFFDPKVHKFGYSGYQYVTGEDINTNPHAPWAFMDVDAGRPMIWHQSVAFATNHGLKSYLESMAAYQVYRLLPEDLRTGRQASTFLTTALAATTPYNIMLANAAFTMGGPEETLEQWNTFERAVKSNSKRAGNRSDLYLSTVRAGVVDRLASMPAPKDGNLANKLKKFQKLREEELRSIAKMAKAAG